MKFRDKIPSSASNFLKLGDGESATGVFLGELYDFFQLWVQEPGGKKVSKEVPEGTDGSKFRFRVNFVTKGEDGKYVPKVFESGVDVYRRLKTIHEKFGSLPDTLVEITKHGTEMNTKYDLMPLKGQVSSEAKQTKLIDLKKERGPMPKARQEFPEPDFGPSPVYENDDEIPF